MKIRLVRPVRDDGCDYRNSLREDRDYIVLAIGCSMYRVLEEFGEPVLYETDAFEVTDTTEPDFWYKEVLDECEYAGPVDWRQPGFFEKWHDGDAATIEKFRKDIFKYYPEAAPDLIPKRFRKVPGKCSTSTDAADEMQN